MCLFVRWQSHILRWTFQFKAILYDHAVINYSYFCRTFQGTISIECWSSPDNIIGLPFSWFLCRVEQGSSLFIDASSHPICIGFIIVGIQDLQFITQVSFSY
ncbi:hypothetical protein D3C85_1605890 [compost metagenome]